MYIMYASSSVDYACGIQTAVVCNCVLHSGYHIVLFYMYDLYTKFSCMFQYIYNPVFAKCK